MSCVVGWVDELLLSRAVDILILGEGWFLPKQPTTELSSPVPGVLGRTVSLHASLSVFSSRARHDLDVASIDYGGEHMALVPSQYMKYTQRFWDWLQSRGGYARGLWAPDGGTELWRQPEVLL